MKKSDLIEALIENNQDLSPSEIKIFVDLFFREIVEAMARGETVALRGFGTFGVRYKRGRVARNPKTGANVSLDERKSGYFRRSDKLAKNMNQSK